MSEPTFWKHVTKGLSDDDCWGWSASKDKDGYGHVGHHGKLERAHRVSWELHHGVPPRNINILHSCDNRECTNPRHLFSGTQKDNVMDMCRKGRQRTKVTVDIVRRIRREREMALTLPFLAERFDLPWHVVQCIVARRTWKWVE